MSNVTYAYRELLARLTERLRQGERSIDKLMQHAQHELADWPGLQPHQPEQILQALRRDLSEFARSYQENQAEEFSDSVFMRVIRQSLWKELADITDRSQLEWHDVFEDLNHHGVYHSGEVVGLGKLVCERCQFTREIYTPETLAHCPQCGHDSFYRQPFTP
ncbi:hypothetical protein BL250_02465 [Erwinia sp. OLTSP20]|uniref:zinc ribbon-containing protein n=1 Tax=unclassified Erwinia TaxID=2622719 RepID=UPI000C18541F|nr:MULTISPECIES: zinc ribbon-containing protein [unclassified Erwinia]PIJ48792.1 hypothetical protein BV501_16075 [Erwinia sp. OAMSP11]PIJ69416.1 hypothetical protein BK416_15020 [Erwinia sp. OLSSP12]PIJ79250.1 hypothetical protein BLD47_15325 [Erwinia sp. OLCASP19]PIJ80776.1 hypothetical protein BLD46_14485 [Erwinia sp. OLMTSP26]PIJ82928.1 hypothetical protein BLD49_14380 [Erwinia sp. OLMDSP33]